MYILNDCSFQKFIDILYYFLLQLCIKKLHLKFSTKLFQRDRIKVS